MVFAKEHGGVYYDIIYAYNCRNQCIREKRKLWAYRMQIIRYAYDVAGRLVRRIVPSGKQMGWCSGEALDK